MNTFAPLLRRISLLVSVGFLLLYVPARADDWPQWRGPTRDGVWHEKGILESFPSTGLKVRWRVPVSIGYSSPVVAEGRVFVVDCVLGPKEIQQAKERIHCFDEATGRLLWSHCFDADYPDFAWPPASDYGGPIATPIVQGGKLYAVGGVGDLLCLDTLKGGVLWKKNLAKEYAIGGDFCRSGSPLIEGNLLVVQTACNKPKAGIVAFEKDTGKEVWTALDGHGYFSSPLVIAAADKRQLIAVTDRVVTSLDPITGETYWRERFTLFRNIPTPVFASNRLLVNGMMFALDADQPAVRVLWPERPPDAFLSDTTTALFVGDLVLSHKRPDLLVCLEADTGMLLWETDKVKSTTHSLVLCGDDVFIFTDQGELIQARVDRQGYKEVSRAALIKPTIWAGTDKWVLYAAPAYANGHVFARNDEELICACLTVDR
jgi:outer membrane protein assembly factor BamB